MIEARLPVLGNRRPYKSGWSYEKTSSGARRADRTGHRWSVHWFSGRSEGSRRTDRQSGRSGIWPRYPDGLGTWADRIGARKFKLRHYPRADARWFRFSASSVANAAALLPAELHFPVYEEGY